MDFSYRGNRPAQPAGAGTENVTSTGTGKSHKHGGKVGGLKLVSVALLFSITILLLALSASLVFGSPSSEGKYVRKKQMQAVFLNGGQVYFGDITSLNDKYVRLQNIYYLRVNQQVQPNQQNSQAQNDISLVKLGCELHGPDDEMVINRDQVVFWENLKTDGQVAQAVAKYVKDNPNGQKCETASQSSTPSSTTTTPTTTTPAKKQ